MTTSAIPAPDWVAEGELEQYKVRLKGYESALTSVRFEVRNKQPISFSQFAHDYARILLESTCSREP